MKSVADEFDVFDSGAQRFSDVASVLASNARLTDLLEVLQRERDQLDLLLDVTNAVVTQLDTRELFRAVAPALRRCCSADVAALSVYDPEAGVLRHHVCDAPEDFRTASDVPMPGESTIEGSAAGYVFKTGEPRIFSVSDLEAFPESAFICSRGIRTGVFMFLLMFVVAPIVGLIATFGLGIEPWPVGVVVTLLGLGGLLRIVYALMFESSAPVAITEPRTPSALDPSSATFATSALPPHRSVPASEYTSPQPGTWREPQASEPSSVTDDTTKLLEKEEIMARDLEN